ncbi:uncharacterized protein MAM_01313 [Metarhizium album ARSEF 1941]|uniref:Uncharacterized protein n=1 Tax=Metarhizium album (strain ARSEF 1941) TaxID=1081103 RepID=A0A0B2X504_METAS|nr:uncharacterized protein MAM_01313 [Metarhizium album ARSEF 1941]KHO00535.1 hypothetical protein MAM_01313 [Metarhizium album ARSEF 1941]
MSSQSEARRLQRKIDSLRRNVERNSKKLETIRTKEAARLGIKVRRAEETRSRTRYVNARTALNEEMAKIEEGEEIDEIKLQRLKATCNEAGMDHTMARTRVWLVTKAAEEIWRMHKKDNELLENHIVFLSNLLENPPTATPSDPEEHEEHERADGRPDSS